MTVRKVALSDGDFIKGYWSHQTDEDLLRLGELTRPDPIANLKFLEWFCKTADAPLIGKEDIRMWCADGTVVGYSTLKEFSPKGTGQIHLHMAKAYWRKGWGSVLFCLSARDFLTAYELQSLYCQPRAENPMPNGMLKKVGFKNLGLVNYVRRDGSAISQNCFEIEPKVIQKFLKRSKKHFNLFDETDGLGT